MKHQCCACLSERAIKLCFTDFTLCEGSPADPLKEALWLHLWWCSFFKAHLNLLLKTLNPDTLLKQLILFLVLICNHDFPPVCGVTITQLHICFNPIIMNLSVLMKGCPFHSKYKYTIKVSPPVISFPFYQLCTSLRFIVFEWHALKAPVIFHFLIFHHYPTKTAAGGKCR